MTDIKEALAIHRAPMGSKPDALANGRLAEARRLTSLLNRGGNFSFVRLGDYDVAYLLNPAAAAAAFNPSQKMVSGTQAGGSPGLEQDQAMRLRTALEQASYVDLWELQWKDNTLLDQLALNRSPEGFRNPSRGSSNILPTWLEHEFKNYCQGRRVLFCGAEAPLLENLLKRKDFRDCAADFWPESCEAFFLRPRQDGLNLGDNLDLIKNDLREAIQRHQIDTLFLSLGGGAKILCAELAEELDIRAIDFGASLRSLTYSGSDGNLAARSTHLVFLYRVPFGLFMDALEETYPDLTSETLLAKAHAQLLLEVQEKEVGWTHSASENDFSLSNRTLFRETHCQYLRRYRRLFTFSAATRRERAAFLHFCGKHRLTREGRAFYFGFWLKGLIARLLADSRSKCPKK